MPSTATELTRRSALTVLAAGAALSPLAARAGHDGGPALYLSSRRLPDGRNTVALVDKHGDIVGESSIDGRGHGGTIAPDGRHCVVFARRPGRQALVLDRADGSLLHEIQAREDRHFYGHGFYAPSGKLLFATENDFNAARGVLGIYDVAAGYRRVGEYDSHGIGPHQCLLMSDGRTAAIANGGIETHPDFPRQKLNLTVMAPSMVYLDIRTGEKLAQTAFPGELHQVSLRHIAEGKSGTIWIGGQYQGSPSDDVPIVAGQQPGSPFQNLRSLGTDGIRSRRYIGSVATSAGGHRVAVTAPRGGLALVLDSDTGAVLQRHEIPDVCGVAPHGNGFLFSDGSGGLWHNGARLKQMPGIAWDNHLTPLFRS